MKITNLTLSALILHLALLLSPIVAMETPNQCAGHVILTLVLDEIKESTFEFSNKSLFLSLRLVSTHSLKIVENDCQRRININPDLVHSTVNVHNFPNSMTLLYFVRKRAEEKYQLGLCCFSATIGHKDAPRYLHWAAMAGHADAQYVLGVILYNEIGEDKRESAINCFKMASDRGNIYAQLRLGQIYYQEKNTDLARFYWEKAAAQGNDNAKKNLASLIGR